MADEENKNENPSQDQDNQKSQEPEESQGTPENSGEEEVPSEEENSGGFKASKGMIIAGLIVFVVVLFGVQEYIHFGDKENKGAESSKKAVPQQAKPVTAAAKLPAPASAPRTSSMHSGESIVPSAPAQPHTQSKKQIEQIIDKYIEQNPEIVAKALQNLNAKMDKQRESSSKNYLKENISNIVENQIYLGNPNGKNVIVEFFDYKCSYCRRSHLVMERVLKDYPSVKLILVPIPMLGKNSAEAARGAVAVWNLSRKHFSDFHEALINSQSIDENTVNSIAAKLGISSESLDKEMKSPEVQKAVERSLGIAQNVGIRGVPTFVVDGELVPGSLSYEGFKEMLNKHASKR